MSNEMMSLRALVVVWVCLRALNTTAQVVPPEMRCAPTACTCEVIALGAQISCELNKTLAHRPGGTAYMRTTEVLIEQQPAQMAGLDLEKLKKDLVTGLQTDPGAREIGFANGVVMAPSGKRTSRTNLLHIIISRKGAAVWITATYSMGEGALKQTLYSRDPSFVVITPEYLK